jgi:hypothetical protein
MLNDQSKRMKLARYEIVHSIHTHVGDLCGGRLSIQRLEVGFQQSQQQQQQQQQQRLCTSVCVCVCVCWLEEFV